MKLTALAKATLALGILTTGVFTAESKAVHAKVELDETQRKYYINMLNTILKKVLNQQTLALKVKITMVLTF